MNLRELIKNIPSSNMIRDDVLKFFEKSVFYTYDGKDIRDCSGRYNDKIFSYGDYNTFITKHHYITGKVIKNKNKKINTINVRDLRKDGLIRGDNKSTRAIINDINVEFNNQLHFEKEVVVPVNREIMQDLAQDIINLINSGELSSKEEEIYRKFINKSHFRLDYYNSEYGINIEHDGSTYHIKQLDEIRDKYLKIIFPNIIIIRVIDYMKYDSKKNYIVDIKEKDKLIAGLKEIVSKPKLPQPLLIDFREEIFIEYFKQNFLKLKHISDKLNSGKTIEELIQLGDEDILSIDYHNNK